MIGVITLDGAMFVSKEAAFDIFEEQFELPEYAGRNLDALWDELTEYEFSPIVIVRARQIVSNLGDYGIKILDLFGDLQDEGLQKVTIYW